MIVDLERNDLSRVCEPGSVRWPELMTERAARGRRRTWSRPSRARCARTWRWPSCSTATFPGGSITGAPKISAIDHIAALEPVGRGASMGALGTIQPNGDLDLALTIRTFAIADGRDPSLGRRRDRLGLGSRTRRSRSRSSRRGRCSQPSALALPEPVPRMNVLALAVSGRGSSPPGEPVLHADDEAFLRGRGAFESLRVYGGRPFRLAEHLDRLAGLVREAGVELAGTGTASRSSCTWRSTRPSEMEAVLRVYATPGHGDGPIALAVRRRAA